jgi:hypothetical protein
MRSLNLGVRYTICSLGGSCETIGCSAVGTRDALGAWRKSYSTGSISDSQADESLVCIFNASLGEWSKHKAPRLGASLAFYTLLSIAPLLLVLVSIVGLVLGRQTAEQDIVSQVQALVGSQGAVAAQALLESSRHTAHGIIAAAFGLLTLVIRC